MFDGTIIANIEQYFYLEYALSVWALTALVRYVFKGIDWSIHPKYTTLMVALIMGRNDPGFVHNGPLAGLVAVCAGSDLMHPMGALVTGGVAGALFVWMFTLTQNRWKIDDVLGVWPLHGLCGAWGGIAAGIFGVKSMGGLGGGLGIGGIAVTNRPGLIGALVVGVAGRAVSALIGRCLPARCRWNRAPPPRPAGTRRWPSPAAARG